MKQVSHSGPKNVKCHQTTFSQPAQPSAQGSCIPWFITLFRPPFRLPLTGSQVILMHMSTLAAILHLLLNIIILPFRVSKSISWVHLHQKWTPLISRQAEARKVKYCLTGDIRQSKDKECINVSCTSHSSSRIRGTRTH